MNIWELLFEGIKKFAGEIISIALIAVLLALFPSLKKFFGKTDPKKDETDVQRLEALLKNEIQKQFEAQKNNNNTLTEKEKEKIRLESQQKIAEIEAQLKEAQLQAEEAQRKIEESKRKIEEIKQKVEENKNNIQKQNNEPTDAKSQFELGEKYHQEENDEEAVYWYRKAAQQGEVDSQRSLGEMYFYGWGVKKDYNEAVKWYCKAAQQGDTDAQNNLKRLGKSW